MNVRQTLKSAKMSLSPLVPSWVQREKKTLLNMTQTSMSAYFQSLNRKKKIIEDAVVKEGCSKGGSKTINYPDGSRARVVSAVLMAAPYSGFQPSPGQQKQNAATGSCSNGMDICGTLKAPLVKGIQLLPAKPLGSPKVQKLNILEI